MMVLQEWKKTSFSTSQGIQALLKSLVSWDPTSLRKDSPRYHKVDVAEHSLWVPPESLQCFVTLEDTQRDVVMLKELEK